MSLQDLSFSLFAQSNSDIPRWRHEGRFVRLACIALALALALAPLVRLLTSAFAPGGDWQTGLVWNELNSRSAITATWHTLITGTVSAIGALVIGSALALALATTDVRGRHLIGFLFILSMLMAPQVVALAFIMMAGPSSPLLGIFGLAPPAGSSNPFLGAEGVTLVLALHNAPLAFVTVMAGMKTLPRSVIEASVLDGASCAYIIRSVILPLLRPHLGAAALLAFVAATGNFGIPAILGMRVGYQTLPTLIYQQISSFGPSALPEAAALCLPVALIAIIAVFASRWVERAGVGQKLENEPPFERFWRLGQSRIWVEAAIWALIGVMLVLPLLSLLSTAVTSAYGARLTIASITLDKFIEVLQREPVTIRALRNSLLFSGSTALLLGLFALPVAYSIQQLRCRWRRVLEGLIEIPFALPGVVLAIAMILLFLKPLPLVGVSIYATPLIILIAYIVRFLPLALKAPLAAMAQIDVAPEEAAAVFGASFAQRFRDIVAPILAPAATAGALLVFLTSFNELTVSTLLWSAGTETLGVALFSLEEAGLSGEASALALVATSAILVAMLVLDSLNRHLPSGVVPWRI